MQKSINPSKNILTILIALFILAVSIFVIQIVFGGVPITPKTPVISTETPEVDLILDIPQKALWRNYLTVSAEAPLGTTCVLLYIPPSGDSQELSSVANENGICTWRWKIEETDGKGNARLIFTIDGKSETHFIEIRRSF